MPKAFKHTGVLMMLAVVALGLVGAGYALWYEELSVTTTIQTGTFNADWSLHRQSDNGTTTSTDGGAVVCLVGGTGDCTNGANYLTAAQVQALGGYGDINRVNSKMPTCKASLGSSGAADTESSNDALQTGTLITF